MQTLGSKYACRMRAGNMQSKGPTWHQFGSQWCGEVKAWQFAKQSLRAYQKGRLGHTVQALTGHILV